MRVLESRFLGGPNVYQMAPCFVSLLDLDCHRLFRDEAPPRGAARPRSATLAGHAPVIVDPGEVARRVVRIMIALQSWAGSPITLSDTIGPVPAGPGRYRLICDYYDEAVAKEALRISVALVSALLSDRPFDLDSRLGELRILADAHAGEPRLETLLRSARKRGIPVIRLEADCASFALGWGIRQQQFPAKPPDRAWRGPSLQAMFSEDNGRIPVVAVTGTNGKTTTTQLIAHVLRACGVRTGTTTTQGIFIDGKCVRTGDCSGYWSARRVLSDRAVEVATLETARGGILKRGLAFDRCDVGVVLNVSSDHLGLDGVETLQDLANVKGLVARCARIAAVLNGDDALCVEMRETLASGCKPVFFTLDPRNQVLLDHLRSGGAGACLDDDGWLVWCRAEEQTRVVKAADLPFTWSGHARYNTANALAALAALRCMGYETAVIARALARFVSDAKSNPLRGNQFEVDGVKLIVDYAHNAVAYRAICETARSLLTGTARLLGVVTSPGDRRPEDLNATGRVCGQGFDELVVYEQDPRGRAAGTTTQLILRGARSAAPGKPFHGEPKIRLALGRGLKAASPGDVVIFTCAGSFDDLVEGVRLRSPAAAERIAREVRGDAERPMMAAP